MQYISTHRNTYVHTCIHIVIYAYNTYIYIYIYICIYLYKGILEYRVVKVKVSNQPPIICLPQAFL